MTDLFLLLAMFNQHYPFNRIGQHETIAVPVSFESGELGTFKLPTLAYRSKIVAVKTAVTKAIAASNDATVTLKKGNTTIATVTLAAESPINDEDSATPDEVIVDTDEQYSITTAKSSAGGKAMLYLTLEVLTSH